MSKSRDIADSAATINYIDGLTSDAQGQIDTATSDIATNASDIATKAPLSNPTFTGTVTATAFSGDGSGLTGVDSLPSQTGNNGLFLTTDGSTASWAAAGASIERRTISGATTLGTSDKSKLIDITSGAFTLSFAAAATLGDGWFCYVRNFGSGDVTLDPNGSETIDSLTSFKCYPKEVRLIQCNGTSFFSVVLNGFSKQSDSTFTFTKPPGYSRFTGFLWGGGGGGAGSSIYAMGGGGGSCNPFDVPADDFSATETITVGAGGAVNTAGGTSSIGTLVYAYGGGNGSNGGQPGAGGSINGNSGTAPGLPSRTNYTHPVGGATGGGNSFTGSPTGAYYGGAAGQSVSNGLFYLKAAVWGGGGGGSQNGATGLGGTSLYGGNGGNTSASNAGAQAPTVPGGGGYGLYSTESVGADGAGGRCIILGVI